MEGPTGLFWGKVDESNFMGGFEQMTCLQAGIVIWLGVFFCWCMLWNWIAGQKLKANCFIIFEKKYFFSYLCILSAESLPSQDQASPFTGELGTT